MIQTKFIYAGVLLLGLVILLVVLLSNKNKDEDPKNEDAKNDEDQMKGTCDCTLVSDATDYCLSGGKRVPNQLILDPRTLCTNQNNQGEQNCLNAGSQGTCKWTPEK